MPPDCSHGGSRWERTPPRRPFRRCLRHWNLSLELNVPRQSAGIYACASGAVSVAGRFAWPGISARSHRVRDARPVGRARGLRSASAVELRPGPRRSNPSESARAMNGFPSASIFRISECVYANTSTPIPTPAGAYRTNRSGNGRSVRLTTTSKSASLPGPASPLASEPNRTTRSISGHRLFWVSIAFRIS